MYSGIPKMSKKKIIEISILICILLWVLFLMINYFRYTADKPPLFAIHTKTVCDDGFVHNYGTLGYSYRKYESTSTNFTEFVPFWEPIKQCQITNGLPATYSNYPVPSNPKYQPNYRGLVYFFSGRTNLVGAYKCVNTDDSCTLATSGYDEFNIDNTDILLALKEQPNMGLLYDRFGFVDDSLKQEFKKGDSQYARTIYYYDVRGNKILEKFADVKHSTIDRYGYGIGDPNNNYVVRDYDSRKWGLVNFKEDGTYEKLLDYEYDSINYNIYTGFYILSKDEKWYVYDLNKDEYIIKDYDGVIYDFWENNNMSYYYKTGYKTKLDTGEEYYAYSIKKVDGDDLLDVSNVASIVHTRNIIMYWKYDDNTLHFMDYVQNDKVVPIQLFFRELDTENNHFMPAFEYTISDDRKSISIKVFERRDLDSPFHIYMVNSSLWKY